MKKILLFLFLLKSFYSFSQGKKIYYVDENYKKIDFFKYQKKKSSKMFELIFVENDTAIFKKFRHIKFYGKLDKTKKNQLSQLFQKRFDIDSKKSLIIHYIDTIPNKEKMPKKSGIEFIDDSGKETGIFLTNNEFKSSFNKYPYTRHKHKLSAKDYIKNIIKEKKKIKNNTELVHFYDYNKGFQAKELAKVGYFKDYKSLIRRMFTDGMKMYQVILIHQNGEFYASRFGNFKEERKLVSKKKYFDKQKTKWLKKINKTK